MIFYRLKKVDNIGWIPFVGFETITPEMSKVASFRINGKIYEEYSSELVEAFEADTTWDLLLYQHPAND